MPLRKTYNVFLGPKHDMFGIVKGVPQDAIAVLDNRNSDFKLSVISHEETNTFIKKIKSTDSSARKTRVVSNTSDVQMTNVFNSNGDPLYYKVEKDIGILYDRVTVNGLPAEAEDSNFYYLNAEEALVEYRLNEDIVFSTQSEVFPVFIWQEYKNLDSVMAKDKRHYYYRGSKDSVMVTASKPDVVASVKNEPVFKLNRVKFNKVSLSPFLVRTLRSGTSDRLSFIYDYLTTKPDHEKVFSEQVIVNSSGIIILDNANVFKDSVFIKRRVDREEERVADNSQGLLDGLINSSKGEINITPLIEDGLINYGDYIYIEYKYIRLLSELIIDPMSFELRNMVAHFRIGPTKIKKPGLTLDVEPSLTYILTDDEGTLLLNEDNASDYFSLDLHKGWGEDGYGDNGFSGIVDDFSSLTIRSIGQINNDVETPVEEEEEDRGPDTGYGESGFALGPFGGSYLLSIDEIKRLLDIKNNTEAATITIGNISFYSNIESVDAYVRDNLALPLSPARAITESVYANSVIIFDYDAEKMKSMAISKYLSHSGIHLPSTWIKRYDDRISLEFDISSIAEYVTNTGEIDDVLLLMPGTDVSATNMANRFMSLYPTQEIVATDLALFTLNKTTNEVLFVSFDLFIASDFLTINGSIDLGIENIGLGFRSADRDIYPLVFINLEEFH